MCIRDSVMGRDVGRPSVDQLFRDVNLSQAVVRLVIRRAQRDGDDVVLVLVDRDSQRLRLFQQGFEQHDVVLNFGQRFQNLIVGQIALFNACLLYTSRCV